MIIVALIILIVFILLGLRGLLLLSGRMSARIIEKRHKMMEEIVDSGEVPESWTCRYSKRIAGLKESTGRAQRIEAIAEKTGNSCLKKLDRLIQYSKQSSIAADDETTRILLEELGKARKQWIDKEWEEILVSHSKSSRRVREARS